MKLTETEQELYTERLAIMIYHGEIEPEIAEREALKCIERMRAIENN